MPSTADNPSAAEANVTTEVEPNDDVTTAAIQQLPVTIRGTIHRAAQEVTPKPSEPSSAIAISDGAVPTVSDVDSFAFEAEKGSQWMIEVEAARSGSKLDSFIDVVTESGEPILRERFQAVRESYFTFRGKDSTQSDDYRLFGWEKWNLMTIFTRAAN